MIRLKGVSIEFYHPVFKDLDVCFNLGNMYAIFGPSGCGKTTLLNVLSGNVKFDYGEYVVNGEVLDNSKIREFCQSNIFYLTQEASFIENLTCFDNLKTIGHLVGNDLDDERIQSVLKQVGLNIDDKIYPRQLSGGEKQRLQIALALIKDATVLLCDEITRSLDNECKENILNILRDIAHENNKVVIVSSHDDFVKSYCDVVYEINNCSIVSEEVEKVDGSYVKNMKHSKKLIKTIIDGNFKSSKLNYIFFSLFMMIAICLCFIASQAGNQYSENLERLSNTTSKNVFYAFNLIDERIGESAASRDIVCLPLSFNQINELQSIPEVQSCYPFYYGDFLYLKGSNITFTVEKNGEVSEIDYPLNSMKNTLVASYPEQHVEKFCDAYLKNEKGIYLNAGMAKALGIDNIKTRTTIKFNVNIPVAYTLDEHASITNEKGTFGITGRVPIFKEVTIEALVVGILDDLHQSVYDSLGYLDYETLEDITLQCIEEHELQEGEYKASPFSYVMVFDEKDYLTVYEKVKAIEGNVYVYSLQKTIYDFMSGWIGLEAPMKIYATVIFGIMVILTMVYSFFDYSKNKHDLNIMYQWGVTQLEMKKYIASKVMRMFKTLTIGSVLLVVIVNEITLKMGILAATKGSHERFFINIIGCIVFSFIIAVSTNVISYYKGIKLYRD